MKMAIIGAAGSVGSAAAFHIGSLNLLSEIKLLDMNKKLLKNHVMDMSQALPELSDTRVSMGEYSDLDNCDIIMLVAARPQTKVASRNEWLLNNITLLDGILSEIAKHASNKILLTTTNPVDVCNYFNFKKLGWNKRKLIGFSLNDSVRVKWAIEQVTGLEYKKLETICIGEHGEKQVPLWDQTLYYGKPLELSGEKREAAKGKVAGWLGEYMETDLSRSTAWLSSISLGRLIRDIVQGSKKPVPASAILEGEYGESAVSLGVPVLLGPSGIEKIVDLNLTPEQWKQYRDAADNVRNLIGIAGIK